MKNFKERQIEILNKEYQLNTMTEFLLIDILESLSDKQLESISVLEIDGEDVLMLNKDGDYKDDMIWDDYNFSVFDKTQVFQKEVIDLILDKILK